MAFDVLKNPEVFTDRVNSKTLYKNASWQFYGAGDGCKAGLVDLQDYRNFFPYITQTESILQNPLGVIPYDIALTPYDADMNWIDDTFNPNFRGEYNYNCVAGNSWTEDFPSPSGIMGSWGMDWFNNQYGVYKPDQTTIFDRREATGEFWVRNINKQIIGQANTILSDVVDNYSWHNTLSSVNFDSGVTDVKIYNDILFVRTPTHAIFEKLRLDTESGIFSLIDESAVLSYEGAFPEPYFENDKLWFTSFSADSQSLYNYDGNLTQVASYDTVSAASESFSRDTRYNSWVSSRIGDDGYLSNIEYRKCSNGISVTAMDIAHIGEDFRLLDYESVNGDNYYVFEDQSNPTLYLGVDRVHDVSDPLLRQFSQLIPVYHNENRDYTNPTIDTNNLISISALEGARDVSLRQNSLNILTKPISAALFGNEDPFVRKADVDSPIALQYLITAGLANVSGSKELPFHALPLKTLQNNSYEYTCVDDVRVYETLHFGNKGLDYDKPVFGYTSNYRSITFEPDKETKFVYPHNAVEMPVSASSLACDGSVVGNCPSNSDIIVHHSTEYNLPNQRKFYTWLSGDDCNVQWVDRYIETGNEAVSAINYTDEIPSQMMLRAGDEYTYVRRGKALNDAYIAGLSSTLVFQIDGIFEGVALDSSGNGFDSPLIT